MDDAMILRCGHSFGGGGIQQVIKMVSSPIVPCARILLSIIDLFDVLV